MIAQAQGSTASRSIAAVLADSVSIEAFGAVGDGITDDTAAFTRALAANVPLRLGPKTYVLQGQFNVSGASVALIGTPGQTRLTRTIQNSNGAWLEIASLKLFAYGVIFDANRLGVAQDSWSLLVTSSCVQAVFEHCRFTGAAGTTMGCGLTVLASFPTVTQHSVVSCEADNNAVHGIWIQAVVGATVSGCRAHDNGTYGIVIDYADPQLVQKLERCSVRGNAAWGNQRGISIGNFNATNMTPPTWGNANPDAISILVEDNLCHGNSSYGLYASGSGLVLSGNLCTNNVAAGITANISYSVVRGNLISGPSYYGIDSGGSIHSDVSGNFVSGVTIGLNPGGSQNVRVSGNHLSECTGWAVQINNVETDGAGANFNIPSSNIEVINNWISLSGNVAGGISILDGAQYVSVSNNWFSGQAGALVSQALLARTDTLGICGNSWNASGIASVTPVFVGGLQQLVFPDVLDGIRVSDVGAPVQSIVSAQQAAAAGSISFIQITTGGTGYTHATVAIGGMGNGAQASVVLSDGGVIGAVMISQGNSYGASGGSFPVTIVGDGQGATANAFIGLPVPAGRRLAVQCLQTVVFADTSTTPVQQNWTENPMTVPAGSTVYWRGTAGGWNAESVPLADYIMPTQGGAVTISSVGNGDIDLQPSGLGVVRFSTQDNPTGYCTAIGLGTPEGVVSAPPGSDYRNLSGGVGATFWIKQSGTATTGWVAVA
jgi:hypothetical protein